MVPRLFVISNSTCRKFTLEQVRDPRVYSSFVQLRGNGDCQPNFVTRLHGRV